MAISLERQIADVTLAKKRYRSFFLIALVLLLLLGSIVYYYSVLDYAVLENVHISQGGREGPNDIVFTYDVVSPGRIDAVWGKDAVSTQVHSQVSKGVRFEMMQPANGQVEISLRSRRAVVPHWDSQTFSF